MERFLEHTRRSAGDVIGRLLPENRAATVWSIAVNGVMAGCRPEYMPVLIAIVEAIAEPVFRVDDAGSTPGWEPLVIVSGPIAHALDLNHGQGVMRVGRPGQHDARPLRAPVPARRRGAAHSARRRRQGQHRGLVQRRARRGWEAVAALGWSTFGIDQGFASVVSITPPIYSAGTRALDHARILAEVFGGACAYWSSIAS